jgi:hypothetical protein
MKENPFLWLFPIILTVIFTVCIIGYGKNIYKLTQCDFREPYKAEVLHTVGLLPIVGIFTGYMDFGK